MTGVRQPVLCFGSVLDNRITKNFSRPHRPNIGHSLATENGARFEENDTFRACSTEP
jgi:hypothetical protein